MKNTKKTLLKVTCVSILISFATAVFADPGRWHDHDWHHGDCYHCHGHYWHHDRHWHHGYYPPPAPGPIIRVDIDGHHHHH